MSGPRLLAALLLLSLVNCTMPLRCGCEAPAAQTSEDATLDGRLVRCSALGDKAHEDPDCESAFSEARGRLFRVPAEK